MFSYKLLSLLLAFDKYALNRFRKYLHSPYFNEQEDIIRLFEACNTVVRRGGDALLTFDKLSAWRAVYPESPFDDAQLRRLSSELTHFALRFKALESWANDPLNELIYMQEIADQYELPKHLNSIERQIDRFFTETTEVSAAHYLRQFKVQWNGFQRASKKGASTAAYLDRLSAADQYLEIFYIIQKMKLYAGWLILSNIRSTERIIRLMPDFLALVDASAHMEVPLIKVYRKIIHCLSFPDEETLFESLCIDLEMYARQLTKEDLRECYQIAQNYCAFKVNKGKTHYYPIYFQLIKHTIDLDILLENNQLSEGVFKNIITISLRVGEFVWAEDFIDRYHVFLPSDIRENARTFNLANLYSHQRQFGRVIELLRSVEYNDLSYALSSKLILVRTYYDTQEWMALDSLIDSFRVFLRRNKELSKSFKTEYTNFLLFTKKLSAIHPGNTADLLKTRHQITACNAVVSKKWLLEKLSEME